MNVFEMPKRYRNFILELVRISSNKRKQYDGKSFACVFFTKFCNAGCPFCFFKSDTRKFDIPQEKFEFSEYGFEKFINFINASNNGYLLISGGGEPFEKENYVMQTVKRAKTDRIVIVTSGMWAKEYDNAKKVIFNLYECIKIRNDNLKVVLRLSLDKFHYQQLGYELVKNIISIFKDNFSMNNRFELQIHTMIDDITVDNVIKKLGNCRKVDGGEIRVSDNETLVKIVPKRCKIVFEDGYEILVGMAKTFYPNLKVDKGYWYRESIIGEVNPKSVLRSKAINIRDYSGALILEEIKTSLYYAIRVIQDYLNDGILTYDNIAELPNELIDTIKLNKSQLIKLYNASNYSILSQYEENMQLSQEQWIDMFMLVELGHYEVTAKQIEHSLEIFNQRFEESITDISNLPKIDKSQQYARLIERITFMKQEARDFCISMQEKGVKNGN